MKNARLSPSPLWHRTFSQLVVVAAILGLGCGTRSEAGIKSARQLNAIISLTPAPQLVADGQQLAEAEKNAARTPGAVAFLGIGESMEPLYAPNTAVVVSPIEYDRIKKGMTVVYIKSNGRRVAHSVIGETTDGYLVQGVNNDEADAEVVNEKNLIGVIVQAYATTDTAFRADAVQQFAAKGGKPSPAFGNHT